MASSKAPDSLPVKQSERIMGQYANEVRVTQDRGGIIQTSITHRPYGSSASNSTCAPGTIASTSLLCQPCANRTQQPTQDVVTDPLSTLLQTEGQAQGQH